jgi:hypothetical protein
MIVEDAEFSPTQARRNAKAVARPRPESAIVSQGITFLRMQGWARKVHGGAMGSSGEPDVDACVRGYAVKLEAKRVGEKPTSAQVAAMQRWQKAGAMVGWFTSNDHIAALLTHLGDPEYRTDLTKPGCSCPVHA